MEGFGGLQVMRAFRHLSPLGTRFFPSHPPYCFSCCTQAGTGASLHRDGPRRWRGSGGVIPDLFFLFSLPLPPPLPVVAREIRWQQHRVGSESKCGLRRSSGRTGSRNSFRCCFPFFLSFLCRQTLMANGLKSARR